MNETANTSPSDRLSELAEKLREEFSGSGCAVTRALGELTMVVPRAQLLEIAARLRDDEGFAFDELMDVCGVDYATYGKSEWATEEASSSGFGRGVERDIAMPESGAERFAAVYHLLSVARNQRLRLRVYLDSEEPVLPSVIGIWNGADWFEREAFDLFGILFEGHPDLRRILTDYGFVGHPFRKDFPLIGEVEMRYDPSQQRVVYEPVSIQPRTLVPKVIRSDNRYANQDSEHEQQDANDA